MGPCMLALLALVVVAGGLKLLLVEEDDDHGVRNHHNSHFAWEVLGVDLEVVDHNDHPLGVYGHMGLDGPCLVLSWVHHAHESHHPFPHDLPYHPFRQPAFLLLIAQH